MAEVTICSICGFRNAEHELDCTVCGSVLPGGQGRGDSQTVAATVRENRPATLDSTIRESDSALPGTTRETTAENPGKILTLLPEALRHRYVIEREMKTRGTEAILLVCAEHNSDQRVVVKLYHKGIEPKEDVRQLLAGLDQRHVIRMLEHGCSEGRFFEVLEFAAGGSLADFLLTRKPLAGDVLAQLIAQLADCLAYLHQLSPPVIHRDIKPDNVLVRSISPLQLVVTDFGIASLLEGGTRMAGSVHRTILYAAPESMVGDISPAMDWWSLGMLIAEAAAGRHPLHGLQEQTISIHFAARKPIPLTAIADSRVRLLCAGLLAYDQQQRWNENAVRRWLAGDKSLQAPIEFQPVPASEVGVVEQRARIPFKIGTVQCFTAAELAVGLTTHWDEAVKSLARGLVEAWLKNQLADQELAAHFLDIIEASPNVSAETHLVTFLQFLFPKAVPKQFNVGNSQLAILKMFLQAHAGMAEVQFRLGREYMLGSTIPADRIAAGKFLQLAAVQGNPDAIAELKKIDDFTTSLTMAKNADMEAMFAVARMYECGEGVIRNDREAAYWYQQGADMGHAGSQYHLGLMLEKGQGVSEDLPAAAAWCRKAADQAYAEAENHLGVLYEKGLGLPKDLGAALGWYRKAAAQSLPIAEYHLGVCYAEGVGVERDDVAAVGWYRKAAEQGYGDAQCNLGLMYLHGTGVEKNAAEALAWLKKAAKEGHAGSQYNLGVVYNNGFGGQLNHREALTWYKQAADQGLADAQVELGLMYENGLGVTENYTEALHWYRQAAEQGQKCAQNNLGVLYEKGRGVDQNINIALNWYKKAAAQGLAIAQNNLGVLHEYGTGVPSDMAAAIDWYRQAAEQGNIRAQYNLGRVFEEGKGGEVNYPEAINWYTKAAMQKDRQAMDRLAQLEKTKKKNKQTALYKQYLPSAILFLVGMVGNLVSREPSFSSGIVSGYMLAGIPWGWNWVRARQKTFLESGTYQVWAFYFVILVCCSLFVGLVAMPIGIKRNIDNPYRS